MDMATQWKSVEPNPMLYRHPTVSMRRIGIFLLETREFPPYGHWYGVIRYGKTQEETALCKSEAEVRTACEKLVGDILRTALQDAGLDRCCPCYTGE